jgi:excisionase family DNA binding protein
MGTEQPKIALNRREAAEALSISVDSLDRLVAAGEIRVIRRNRLVLFRRAELERWTEQSQARRIGL